jgi:hypothetical protein
MISTLEFKQALGAYASKLSEQEIERLKGIEEQLADILIEHVLRENPRVDIVKSQNFFIHRYRNFTITNTSIIITYPTWKILKTQ